MRNKIFDDVPKTHKTESGKLVAIFPENGNYRLVDPIAEKELGQILFDGNDNWIYDGETLSMAEQEQIAGAIKGNQKDMDKLNRTIKLFS
jgi:hypothetical protein